MPLRFGTLPVALALTLLTPAPAHADDPVPTVTVRFEHGHRRYVIEGARIHGEPQRPYTFVLGGRHPPAYRTVDSQRSFVDRVMTVVRHAPF